MQVAHTCPGAIWGVGMPAGRWGARASLGPGLLPDLLMPTALPPADPARCSTLAPAEKARPRLLAGEGSRDSGPPLRAT